ncbi:hypothetical protein [Geminicoccus roseus]|uniref:hypothetical protein n=1 Tax=Geminicoccus roseus TaxID=404900 RepID=UPI0004103C5F|nr:hypothetical protein [Geminicoccus roseus]
MTTGSTDYRSNPTLSSTSANSPGAGPRSTTDENRDKAAHAARNTLDTAKAEASNLGHTARAEAEGLGHDLKRQGEELAGVARERAEGFADEQKTAGADQIGGIARAANKAAEELQDTSPLLAGYVRDAASAADEFAGSLRNRNLGEILDDVTNYARREPVVFFGITVAAGFALSRFLKSSAERQGASYDSRRGYGSYGGGHGTDARWSSYGGSADRTTPVASTHSTPMEYPTGRTGTTDPMHGSSSASSTSTTSSSQLGSSAGNPATKPGAPATSSTKVGGPNG